MEKYNSHLKHRLPHNPTLAEFINILQKEELSVAHIYISFVRGSGNIRASGDSSNKKKKTHKFFDDKIFDDLLKSLNTNTDEYDCSPDFYDDFNKGCISKINKKNDENSQISESISDETDYEELDLKSKKDTLDIVNLSGEKA